MSVSIGANKKLLRQGPRDCCKSWEMPPPASGLPLDRSSQGCLESFRVVCFSGFVPSEARVFQKRMPKITKKAKERREEELSRL